MTWWYEIRDADNRVVDGQRGFPTEAEAKEVGERARRSIEDISPGTTLTIVTGDGVWRPE